MNEKVLSMVVEILKTKNRAYGDSALEPLGLLTDCDAETGIKLRMEDKLKRWRTTGTGDGEDTLLDLIGYTLLLHVLQDGRPMERVLDSVRVDRFRCGDLTNVFRGGAEWHTNEQAAVVEYLLANLDRIDADMLAVELIRYYCMLKKDAYHERF